MEQIAAGIERERIGQVTAYRITRMSVEILNAWGSDIIEVLKHTAGEECWLLYDLSASGVGMPYLVLTNNNIFHIGVNNTTRQIIEQLLAAQPRFRVRLAIVLSDSLSGQLTMRRGKAALEQNNRQFCRVFFERSAAINWLESGQD